MSPTSITSSLDLCPQLQTSSQMFLDISSGVSSRVLWLRHLNWVPNFPPKLPSSILQLFRLSLDSPWLLSFSHTLHLTCQQIQSALPKNISELDPLSLTPLLPPWSDRPTIFPHLDFCRNPLTSLPSSAFVPHGSVPKKQPERCY